MKNRISILAGLLIGSTILSGCTGGGTAPTNACVEQYTSVFAAASAGNISVLTKAVKAEPDMVVHTECNKATLLHNAVEHDHLPAVKFLLAQGSAVDAVNTDNMTALHMAARNGNVAIIKLLLAYDASVNVVDSAGMTPVDRALKWQHPDAAALLKKHGGHESKPAQ